MDCRDFKEMLDSYFCQELAVETNHAMLGHAEHCAHCRSEMASRRNLRATLQRACAQDQMSNEACERLRRLLRAEALPGEERSWRRRLADLFALRFAMPIAATAGILVLVASAAAIYRLSSGAWSQGGSARAAQLTDTVMEQAANDHHLCASHWVDGNEPAMESDEVKGFDQACADLDKIAASGSQGLRLRAMHVCGFRGRQFVHLVYTRDQQLVSLLVTARDSQAVKGGIVSPANVPLPQIQRSLQLGLPIGAYQTAKHVVLVVSKLPEAENEALAQQLASPVLNHLRRLDGQQALTTMHHELADLPELDDVIANLRGGKLR